jgi:thiosulfate dehydrogenase [quinone] large subunit
MGWTFLYAGLSQLGNPDFNVAGFLQRTKTSNVALSWLGAGGLAPYTSFLVKWGHTLIGISLLTGCLVRLSAPAGIFLLIVYYFAHMDWPYIESRVNFIVDYHLVYAIVLICLIHKRAGHVFGIDGWLETLPAVKRFPMLKACVS